jgi:hypothetical protein
MHHIKRLACASVLALSVWVADYTYAQMPDRLNSILNQYRSEEAEERKVRDAYDKTIEQEMKEHEKIRAEIMQHVRPATRQDYHDWLKAYLLDGGKPTDVYDYPFARWGDFYVATNNFTLPPLYGALGIHLIVPKGIIVACPNLGHNNIYRYMPMSAEGYMVPIFSDTEF